MENQSNTAIEYLYRDGSNCKQWHRVVVEGTITREQVLPFLDEEQYFIPSQVGLEDLQGRFGTVDLDAADHVWHTLLEMTPTSEPPTIALPAAQIYLQFQAVRWDVEAAERRFRPA